MSYYSPFTISSRKLTVVLGYLPRASPLLDQPRNSLTGGEIVSDHDQQDLAAEGLLTFEELGEKLAALEDVRDLARRELETLKGKRERLEDLRRDRDAVLEAYANVTAEALEELSAEERNKHYKIRKLRVVIRDDGTPEVSGVFCGSLGIPEVEAFAERNAMPAALSV
jgi:hypothetical protein